MKSDSGTALLQWYDHGHRDLPWRRTRDPYRIWLSEIMLQQTRVETVKGYYARFLDLFPTVGALASAPEEQVLKAWEGLGYYSRARNLRKAAAIVTNELNGRFPDTYDGLLKLCGVGAYTAGAIASIAFDAPVAAIDGNVTRVAARYFGVREDVGAPSVQKQIHSLVSGWLVASRPGDFNQALMELGATVCLPAAPDCARCPLRMSCDAFEEGDAALLPVHEKKRPPKVVETTVCLLVCGDRVVTMRRSQRMLGGLYVFYLVQDGQSPERIVAELREQGLACSDLGSLCHARHVFTHQVWEMDVRLFSMQKAPEGAVLERLQANLSSVADLEQLPMPTAMKVAREQAIQALRKRGEPHRAPR